MIVFLLSLIFYIITKFIYKYNFESDSILIEESHEENSILNLYSKVIKIIKSQHLFIHIKYLQDYTKTNKSNYIFINERLLIAGLIGTLATIVLYYGFYIHAFYLSFAFIIFYIIFSLIFWYKIPYQNNNEQLNQKQKRLLHFSPIIISLSIMGIILEFIFSLFRE